MKENKIKLLFTVSGDTGGCFHLEERRAKGWCLDCLEFIGIL